MMILTKSPRSYPKQLYLSFVRLYNFVSEVDSMELRGRRLYFTLPKREGDNHRVVTWLYEKLAVALKSIEQKYFPESVHATYPSFSLLYEDREDSISIVISGVFFIPPPSFVKLLSLFLWYEIRQQTGVKPGHSEKGRRLTGKLKAEVSRFKEKLERSHFQLVRTEVDERCVFCGIQSSLLSVWQYRFNSENVVVEMPVCQKHRTRRI